MPSSLEAWFMALYPKKVRRDCELQSSISRFEQAVAVGSADVDRVVVITERVVVVMTERVEVAKVR